MVSSEKNGHVVIGHGGDTIDFHTEFELMPAEGVGIYYNFNSRGKNDAVYVARAQLLEEFLNRYFPAPKSAQTARRKTLPTAKQDARAIAGLYESSRRVQHGFLSFFYLLQQTSIAEQGRRHDQRRSRRTRRGQRDVRGSRHRKSGASSTVRARSRCAPSAA